MKQVLKTALCAIVLITLLIPGALAQEKMNQNFYTLTDYSNPEQVRIQGMTIVGDAMYMLAMFNSAEKATLERWRAGMEKPEVLLDSLSIYEYDENNKPLSTNVSMLFADGKQVYGYNANTGDVCVLVDETGKAGQKTLYQLDISGFAVQQDGYLDVGNLLNLFAQDGVLYLLNQSYAGEASTALVQYDLATGKQLKFDAINKLKTISPYKDGKLLCLWQELDNPYDEKTQKMIPDDIAIFDPQTAAPAIIAQAQANGDDGLCYDAETNTLYFVSNTTIYSLPDMQPNLKVSGYLPMQIWRGNRQDFGLLPGGNYVYSGNEGTYLRGLDMPGIENGALTIAGEYNSMAHNAVVTKHPEMAISMNDSYNGDMEGLTAAMLNGEAATDIFRLSTTSSPVSRLIAKGYAAELNGFPEIMAVAQRLDKRFIEALSKDGKLYGLPLSFYANTMGYNKEVWEESLGLTESDLPKTFVELLDFIANYYADYGEDHPEINLLDNIGLRDNLLQGLMNQYVAYQVKSEGIVKFDTPLFRKLMTALEAIDFKDIDPYAVLGDKVWNDQEAMNEFWQKPALLTSYFDVSAMDVSGRNRHQQMAPLILPLDAGMEPMIPVEINVMIINPRSTRMAQAAMYLSEYALHYDEASTAVTMFPDNAQPVPNRYFEANMKDMTDRMAKLEKQLETADEEAKASLNEEIKWNREYLADMESQRMLVTDEMIAEFRETVSPYLYPMQQTPLTDWSSGGASDLQTQMQQFREGAIDTDTFIREIDKRVKMMMMEDQ